MAKISEITYNLGQVDTSNATSVSIDPKQPFQIGREIYRLNPNKHQLLSWVMRNSRRRPTDTKKFGHLEKAPLFNWITYNGADEAVQGTTGLVFTRALASAYRVYVARTGEIIRFNAEFSTLTSGAVTRNFGSAGAPLLKKGDKCLILPPAHAEGRTMGKGITGQEVYKSFTTSIVDWPVQFTGTKAAERFIDGDPFKNALNDSWEASQGQLEAELLLGGQVEDNSTYDTPLHTTKGLMSFITSNVYSLPGYLTRMDLWDIVAEWKKWNKNGGAIVCSSQVVQLINTWAFSKVIYNQSLQTDGINIQQVTTPSGTFDLVECDLLGEEEHLMGTILFLPRFAGGQGIDYRPLIGNENRDIAYKPVNRDEVDAKEGVIIGEYGWEFHGEERFAVATGLQF